MGLGEILGSTAVFDGVSAGGQSHGFAVGAIDLGVKEEVPAEALGLGRIHAPFCIANLERGGRRAAIEIADAQRHLGRGRGGEQNIDFVAKAEILRSLADIESQLTFALARVPRVDLQDIVFKLKPGKMHAHGLLVKHSQIHPFAIHRVGRRVSQLAQVRAVGGQDRGDAGFVVYFDEESAPALLHQASHRRALLHLDARLGVDVDADQAVGIE